MITIESEIFTYILTQSPQVIFLCVFYLKLKSYYVYDFISFYSTFDYYIHLFLEPCSTIFSFIRLICPRLVCVIFRLQLLVSLV